MMNLGFSGFVLLVAVLLGAGVRIGWYVAQVLGQLLNDGFNWALDVALVWRRAAEGAEKGAAVREPQPTGDGDRVDAAGDKRDHRP